MLSVWQLSYLEPTYPEGLDIEVYSIGALEKSWKDAQMLSEREHVFPYIQNHQKSVQNH